VNSSFIAYVRIGGEKVENCRFESRLSFSHFFSHLTYRDRLDLRRLEDAEPLSALFNSDRPVLTVEVNAKDPHAFGLAHAGLLIGSAWLGDSMQLKRALMMSMLKTESAYAGGNQFQLEVLTDFLMLTLSNEDQWKDAGGRAYSLRRDAKFPTAAPSFAQYCQSPFRSLAHYHICETEDPDSSDLQDHVWGFRPLLASALWRVYEHLPIDQKLQALARIREGVHLPIIASVYDPAVGNLVDWFQNTLKDHASALGMVAGAEGALSVRRALKELDVEAPTHWELTVDLTHTPAWREIVEQLKTRSHYRTQERALVFTPEGEVALPSGLSVGWAANDVQSQKHVMIACQWPLPGDAVQVQARQMFARQTCDKLSAAFWD
jgi:hypothetical protein